MSVDSSILNDRLQILGTIGLIASLIFVGMELRQSRQIAIADIYQQRAAMVIEIQNNRFSPEQFWSAFGKSIAEQPIEQHERMLLNFAWNPWLSYYENNHFQYQMGLLSEEQWNASRNAIGGIVRQPGFEVWWQGQRTSWRASFAEEVDQVLSEERSKRSD